MWNKEHLRFLITVNIPGSGPNHGTFPKSSKVRRSPTLYGGEDHGLYHGVAGEYIRDNDRGTRHS